MSIPGIYLPLLMEMAHMFYDDGFMKLNSSFKNELKHEGVNMLLCVYWITHSILAVICSGTGVDIFCQ